MLKPLLTAIAGNMLICSSSHLFAQDLFVSRQISPKGEYNQKIEGAAADKAGSIYAANLRKDGTIGVLSSGAKRSSIFTRLPSGSIGSGIRFDKGGAMLVADYKGHNILRITSSGRNAEILFSSKHFNQPNDLAVGQDGDVFASDPNFRSGSGRIWRIEKGGARGYVMICSERRMGTTNGLDLSPDGHMLYVSESATGELWAYNISGRVLDQAKLVAKFPREQLDGLRVNASGQIYVACVSCGVVFVVSPNGDILRKVRTTGKNPTNLTFGASDRKTVYVTQRDGGYIESFLVDVPGRE